MPIATTTRNNPLSIYTGGTTADPIGRRPSGLKSPSTPKSPAAATSFLANAPPPPPPLPMKDLNHTINSTSSSFSSKLKTPSKLVVDSLSSNATSTSVSGPHSTMMTATSNKSLSSPPRASAFKDPLQVLKANLSRYTKVNDRMKVVQILKVSPLLRSIGLDSAPTSPTSQEQWQKLEDEVCHSNIVLNGKPLGTFHGQVRIVLLELCARLTKGMKLSPQSLYQALIVRLAPTTSQADSYFQLNAILGSQELILQTPKTQQSQSGSKGSTKPVTVTSPTSSSSSPPPTQLILYETNRQIHAVLTVYHDYGLYRKADIATGKPWVNMIATVHERVNLSTGASARTCSVRFKED